MASILVLESDGRYATSLARMIKNYLPQSTVWVSGDPDLAMEFIDQSMPDLVVADIHLGPNNFLTLLNELISYPDTLALPKVILSSTSDQLDAQSFAKMGVVEVLDKKTYQPSDLIRVIQEVVDG